MASYNIYIGDIRIYIYVYMHMLLHMYVFVRRRDILIFKSDSQCNCLASFGFGRVILGRMPDLDCSLFLCFVCITAVGSVAISTYLFHVGKSNLSPDGGRKCNGTTHDLIF